MIYSLSKSIKSSLTFCSPSTYYALVAKAKILDLGLLHVFFCLSFPPSRKSDNWREGGTWLEEGENLFEPALSRRAGFEKWKRKLIPGE